MPERPVTPADMHAIVAIQCTPPGTAPDFAVGDHIWYRRKGETFIHNAVVAHVRGRVFAVWAPPAGFRIAFPESREAVWLDREEIEVLETLPKDHVF